MAAQESQGNNESKALIDYLGNGGIAGRTFVEITPDSREIYKVIGVYEEVFGDEKDWEEAKKRLEPHGISKEDYCSPRTFFDAVSLSDGSYQIRELNFHLNDREATLEEAPKEPERSNEGQLVQLAAA